MKCGIIGCGYITVDRHIPSLRAIDGVEIQAICDTNPENLKYAAETFNIKNTYLDVQEFFKNEELDFVDIATPGFTHYELVDLALDHKVDVLVEKPICLNLDDLSKLKAKSEETGVKICIIHNYRYREPVIKLKKAIDEGLIGAVEQVNITQHLKHVFDLKAPWNWEEKRNKVLLYELSIHYLDLMMYLGGDFNKVIGFRSESDPILDMTSSVHALLENPHGAMGIVDVKLLASSAYSKVEVFGSAKDALIKFFPHYLRLDGGTVNPLDEWEYEFARLTSFLKLSLRDKLLKPKVRRRVQSHYNLFKLFVDSLREKDTPVPVSIDDILPTMTLLEEFSQRVYGV